MPSDWMIASQRSGVLDVREAREAGGEACFRAGLGFVVISSKEVRRTRGASYDPLRETAIQP